MSQQRLLVMSSGTSVGKTMVTAALTHQLMAQKHSVLALKPIISGWQDHDSDSDTRILLRAAQKQETTVEFDAVSPWRLLAPLSPHMAAPLENTLIALADVVDFCKQPFAEYEYILIETVGGVMVPINHQHHSLDWAKQLGYPAVVVVGSYLGAISHTLTTLTSMHHYGVAIKAVIISESLEANVGLNETKEGLRPFIDKDIPLLTIPRILGKEASWKRVPALLHCLV